MTRKFTHPDEAGSDHPGYVTMDGKKVEIYSTDNGGNYTIHGRMKVSEDPVQWEVNTWTEGGCAFVFEDSHEDLQDAPRKGEFWLNVYPDTYVYETKETANQMARANRIACVKVEYTEGEGLE